MNAAVESPLLVVIEPARDTLRVVGPDAASWLNGVVTADLKRLAPEQGVYTLLLDKVGKIQSDLEVLPAPDGLALGVAAGAAGRVRTFLDRYLVMEDAELAPAPELAWLRLFGAAAAEAASALDGALARGSMDWPGLPGVAVVVPAERVNELAARAVALGGAGAMLASADDWQRLRTRAGFPEFGRDYGVDDNPHEASLERRAVSWSKGCYLGQEVVCMQDMRGRVKRRLVLLDVALDAPPAEGADVTPQSASDAVGTVTSAIVSAGSVLAFARVKAPFFEPGSELSVAGHAAQILPLGGV